MSEPVAPPEALVETAPAPLVSDARTTAPEAPVDTDARDTSPEAPAPVDPAQVTTGTLDPERLVAEGCTLYDMGQIEDALRKWEQALTLDPNHSLARGYANGARRELGHGPMEAAPSPAPVQAEAFHVEEDIDKLLREAVQLYDMGLTEEAITKWERILVLEPHRSEIAGYLRQARTEVGLNASSPAIPTQAAAPEADGLDLKLRQAEHLLTLQRHEEAAFTFQQALSLAPGNARALQGLERCRKPGGQPAAMESRPAPVVSLDAQGRIAMAVMETASPSEPQGIEPPAALVKATQAPREGLSLPDRLRQATEQMPWLKDTKVVASIAGGVLVLGVGYGIFHSYRKDQALKDEVLAARRAATAPVAQQAQAPDLTETPASIRQEAEDTLVTDPLRAYLRAEAFVSRNPNDTSGAQLLEKTRAGLSGGVTGASLAEYQKHLQNGDLEAALKVMDSLLRAQPGDIDLRNRASRLDLALCAAHASQAKWDEAQEDLLRGRALFPSDKVWQVRLKLLEKVKALPKEQRASWIALIG
jgi:tetratricopeptide (TPR) repeat protein